MDTVSGHPASADGLSQVEPVPVSPVPASIPDADIKASLYLKAKKGLYIIWSPEGMTEPRVTHKTHGEAHAIAWQMAKRFPGQKFFVMEKAGKGAFVDREELADKFIAESGKEYHASDCATSNAPAMVPGPCDCDAPLTESNLP